MTMSRGKKRAEKRFLLWCCCRLTSSSWYTFYAGSTCRRHGSLLFLHLLLEKHSRTRLLRNPKDGQKRLLGG